MFFSASLQSEKLMSQHDHVANNYAKIIYQPRIYDPSQTIPSKLVSGVNLVRL
jgi:hypothetical protein